MVESLRHGHGHATVQPVVAALAAVIAMALVEAAVGWLTGSLALVGDAAHLSTDIGTLGLTAAAIRRGRRPANAGHTFGFHRSGILVAAVNGVALIGVAALLAVGASSRLAHPTHVEALPVLITAALALALNGGLAIVLLRAGNELSIRSAALHVIADALGSASVVISAAIIAVTGWSAADPIASYVIAALILFSAIGLLREAMHILAEAAPRDIDLEGVHSLLTSNPDVTGVHDLHVWSLDRNHRALSAHITVADHSLAEVTALLRELETSLCDLYSIDHVTLQPECPSCELPTLYCDIDERHLTLHRDGSAGR